MQKLYTEEGRHLPEIPWETYPRPQMRRKEWLCLNGWWDLQIRKKGSQDGSAFRQEKILVPFCAESLLSGVKEVPAPGDILVYRRALEIPESWSGKRILLHFGAVSRDASVFVNNRLVCRSENGYLPFSADITSVLQDKNNTLEVRVVNDLSQRFPWGKQSAKRGGMWYTPCSGIWQTVWLEPVPEHAIEHLHITTGKDWIEVIIQGAERGIIQLEGQEIPFENGRVRISVNNPRLWSPEDPYLYPFSVLSGNDRVESYFALRTLSVKTVQGKPRLCLNDKPYFFHGLLDQGYWSDGLYTPAEEACFEKDILSMKALGFNMLRKHIKIEPEAFYYACDRLGMVVFQDMVNNGPYHYVRDTVLPTLHLQKKLWTIFNEGWGQFCADDAYRMLKKMDSERFIDSTSGWYHQKLSDVDSLHLYFEKLHLGKKNLPQFLSEYGGYVWKIPEHSFNTEKTYGYRVYETREEYVCAIREMIENSLIPLAKEGLCGAVYTQVSDVEDETNGILTYDRAVQKIQPEELADLSQKLREAVS